jgi:hypothetical protein
VRALHEKVVLVDALRLPTNQFWTAGSAAAICRVVREALAVRCFPFLFQALNIEAFHDGGERIDGDDAAGEPDGHPDI